MSNNHVISLLQRTSIILTNTNSHSNDITHNVNTMSNNNNNNINQNKFIHRVPKYNNNSLHKRCFSTVTSTHIDDNSGNSTSRLILPLDNMLLPRRSDSIICIIEPPNTPSSYNNRYNTESYNSNSITCGLADLNVTNRLYDNTHNNIIHRKLSCY